MTDEYIACVWRCPLVRTTWLLRAASPYLIKAISASNMPHVATPCGRLRRVSAALASLRPTA
eukprot:2049515-Pleurochrysis_carterae.AAC.1